MNVYITTAFAVPFLRRQLAAVSRFCAGAAVFVVATANASREVRRIASLSLPCASTKHLVRELLPLVGSGPGIIIEWDVIPIRDVVPEDAIAVADQYGPYPSVLKWKDRSSLSMEYAMDSVPPFVHSDYRLLPQVAVTSGCGINNHFQAIGNEFLHYHHWANGQTPFGLTTARMACWHEVTAGLPEPDLSLLEKAANFAASAARHIAAGAPQASEEEVARRFAICEGCEHYDGKACKKCGCPVVREKKFLSKLSWANEKCPVGKW